MNVDIGGLITIGISAGAFIVVVILATWNITRWVGKKIDGVYARIDIIKCKNDNTFVRQDVCGVKESTNTKAIEILTNRMDEGFSTLHKKFDSFITERNKA